MILSSTNATKWFFYDRYPNPVYFNTPPLIVYLRAIETFICHKEIELTKVFVLWLCAKYQT